MSEDADVRRTRPLSPGGLAGSEADSAGPVGTLDVLLSKLAREFGDRGIRTDLLVDIQGLA